MDTLPDWPSLNVRLTFIDPEIDPASITRALKVEPSRCWTRGQPRMSGKSRHTDNGWVLQSSLDRAPFEDHLEDLLGRVDVAALRDIAILHRGYVAVAVHEDQGSAGLFLEPGTIQLLADSALGFEVEWYLPREANARTSQEA